MLETPLDLGCPRRRIFGEVVTFFRDVILKHCQFMLIILILVLIFLSTVTDIFCITDFFVSLLKNTNILPAEFIDVRTSRKAERYAAIDLRFSYVTS